MKYISVVLRNVLIVTIFPCIMFGVAGSEKSDLAEQSLKAIEDCIERSPIPWPDDWKNEYIETIHKTIELNPVTSHFAERLEILVKGFMPYWDGLKKTKDKSLFEVHRVQIRWYAEHLMSTELPSEDERLKLRNQYKELWDYATDSLLKQFPFLDPDTVENATKDDLSKCYSKINTPLMPVYLRPMSNEQVRQIKHRWDKLRYIRVDLWRRLDDSSTTPSDNYNSQSSNAERDHVLTQKSMSQLLGQVWAVASQSPDYYLIALKNRSRTIQDRLKSKHQAWNNEDRLEKEHSRQLFQTEHISFLFVALLETPKHLNKSASVDTKDQTSSEHQDESSKGGGAYAVDKSTQEK